MKLTYEEWIVSLQKEFETNGYNDYLVDSADWKDAYDSGISPEDAYENFMLALSEGGCISCEGDDSCSDGGCDDC